MPSLFKKSYNRWFVLAIAIAVAFIATGIRMSYGVFVVPFEQEFSLTRSQAILPISLLTVIWGIAQPFTGALMDSKGPRKAILLAVILLILGLITTAGAQTMWQLVLGYGLLVGSAASGLTVAAFSLLISRWFEEQRGKALGFIGAGMRLSTMAFSPLAAALIVGLGWRSTYLVFAGIIALVVLPLSWLFLKEPERAEEDSPTTGSRGGFLFNSEVRGAVKTRVYWMLMVKYFGCGFTGLFLNAHLPSIALEHGLSPQQGATALGLLGAGGAVGAVLGGWASDRFGRYKSLSIGYIMRGVGLFLFAFFVTDVNSFYVISIIAGMPIFFTVSITQLLVYEIFGIRIAGRMIGLIFLLHQVGATLGPLMGGWMFEANGNYTLMLLIGGAVLFNSAFWGWRLKGSAQRYIAARTDS